MVKTNLVEPRWAAEIGQLSALRETADYDAAAQFDETDGHNACERAESFLDRIRPLLTSSIPPEDLE